MAGAEPDRASLLLGTYLFADLSPAELEPLTRSARTRHAVRGEYIPERNRVMAVVALEPCTLLVLDREHLMPFLFRHPQAMLRMLEGLSSIARHQTELIASLARRPLSQRLLLRLLELAETNARRADGAVITPKISQATLAAMVGVSRENVNRAIATLVGEGTVRIEDGYYVLDDPDGLRREIATGWPLLERRNRRIDV